MTFVTVPKGNGETVEIDIESNITDAILRECMNRGEGSIDYYVDCLEHSCRSLVGKPHEDVSLQPFTFQGTELKFKLRALNSGDSDFILGLYAGPSLSDFDDSQFLVPLDG